MQLVKEGRILGRFSLTTIAVFVLLLAVLFNGVRLLSGEKPEPQEEWLTVWLEVDNLQNSLAYSIAAGEKELMAGKAIVEILGVDVFDSAGQDRSDVLLKLSVLTTPAPRGPLFIDTIVKPGQRLAFQTEQHAISGITLAVGEEPPFVETEKIVELQLVSLPENQADNFFALIEAGAKKTGSAGKTIATVISKRLESLKIVSWDSEGNLKVSDDPNDKAIVLKLNITALKRGDEFFFGNQRISNFDKLSLDFDDFYLNGWVVSIE